MHWASWCPHLSVGHFTGLVSKCAAHRYQQQRARLGMGLLACYLLDVAIALAVSEEHV